MIDKLAALSKRQLFWLLVVVAFLFLDAVSIWITSLAPGSCIPSAIPDSAYSAQHHECPSFHVFLYENAIIYLERIGRLDGGVIFIVALSALVVWQFITYVSEEWTPVGWFFRLDAIDKFTFALVVLAAVTALIFQGQLGAMQGQLNEMQAARRPWASLEGHLIGALTFAPTPRADMKLTLNNLGQSPAFDAWINATMLSWNVKQDPVQEMHKRCDVMRKKRLINPEKDTSQLGYTLFPNRTYDREQTVFVDPAEYTASPQGVDLVMLFVVICGDYKFSFAPEIHSTDLIYDLTTDDPAAFGIFRIMTPGGWNAVISSKPGRIEIDHLKLYQEPGYSYAN